MRDSFRLCLDAAQLLRTTSANNESYNIEDSYLIVLSRPLTRAAHPALPPPFPTSEVAEHTYFRTEHYAQRPSAWPNLALITSRACRDDALPLSLYTPYGAKLPYDGKVRMVLTPRAPCMHWVPVLDERRCAFLMIYGINLTVASCSVAQTQTDFEETCDPMTRNCQVRT